MADVDVSTRDYATVEESISRRFELILVSAYEAASLAESTVRDMHFPVSVVQAVTLTESVTTPTNTMKLYRGTQSISVSAVTEDWSFVTAYKSFAGVGIPLKGIILIPGSGAPDTFVIKDGSDSGAYLYKGALTAAAVLVYPGNNCKPYIDFSECTLTTGHVITFVW